MIEGGKDSASGKIMRAVASVHKRPFTITKEDIDKTIEGEECPNCGNKWELDGKCTTCWEEK